MFQRGFESLRIHHYENEYSWENCLITSSKKLREDYNIVIGCIPDCLETLENIWIENVKVYISVTDLQPSKHLMESKTYYWIPIVEMDKWGLDTFKEFWEVVDSHLGEEIYIHCTAGVNRSRCMVYSYLKFRLRLSDEQISNYFPILKNLDSMWQQVNLAFKNNQKQGHIPSDEKLEKLNLEMIRD